MFFQFQIVVDESTKKDLDLKVEVDHQEENRGKRMRSEIELAEMAATIGIGIGKNYTPHIDFEYMGQNTFLILVSNDSNVNLEKFGWLFRRLIILK